MENRNFKAAASASPPAAPVTPSNGYPTDGNPSTGTPATLPGAFWFHKIGEEMRQVITGFGLTPSDSALNQVFLAIQAGFQSSATAVVPGTIISFAGTAAPSGYLLCPQTVTNVSRTTYAALFSAIGTQWGAGDGSTTFGIPYFAADQLPVQAGAGVVGTNTVGALLAHAHSLPSVYQNGGGNPVWWQSGSAASSYATATGYYGGSANLAAGQRVQFCVKY